MFVRSFYLWFVRPSDSAGLLSRSYDRISAGYDESWTNHMRGLTESLITALELADGDFCIDLTCGTGYATSLLAGKTGARVVGVDRSEGMLACARENCPDSCEFVQADILAWLKQQPSCSADIITCCWGLGYSKPFAVLRQIRRVLKKGGKAAVIDNSIFTLREVVRSSLYTFAEFPEKMKSILHVSFLPGAFALRMYFRLLGMCVIWSQGGKKGYDVSSGAEAIERLRKTGAAAGFEYACEPEDEQEVYERFAQILEERFGAGGRITITHRYLAGIARK